jgi:hypothetical protein
MRSGVPPAGHMELERSREAEDGCTYVDLQIPDHRYLWIVTDYTIMTLGGK